MSAASHLADYSQSLREGVMDTADQSAMHQMADNEAALLAHRADHAPGPQLFAADGVTVLCWGCENPIPPARLAAQPRSAHCVPCLSAIERRRRLRQAAA